MKQTYLTNGPLAATLVTLRFSPITLMKNEYIPKIQDTFRKNGLPEFKELMLQDMDDGSSHQWRFFNLGGSELVVISDITFSYQTFSYTHWDEFKKRMMDLLHIFFDVTDFFNGTILYYLGLRYINAIEAVNWREYFTPSFHGIQLPDTLKATGALEEYHAIFLQAVTRLNSEQTAHIIIKTIQNNEGLHFPPDIVLLTEQVPRKGAMTTILDIEHFAPLIIKPNDSAPIITTLDQLHDGCELVFFDAISDTALKEWT